MPVERTAMQRRLLVSSIVLLWAIFCGVGWGWMQRYVSTPGAQGAAASALPLSLQDAVSRSASGESNRQPAAMQLFVVLHPQCSCLMATIRELERIVQQAAGGPTAGEPLQVSLLLYQPPFCLLTGRRRARFQHSRLPCIVNIARVLGMTVAAEGVETEEQLTLLQELDCDVMQGFVFSRPLPAADARAFLTGTRIQRSATDVPGPSPLRRVALDSFHATGLHVSDVALLDPAAIARESRTSPASEPLHKRQVCCLTPRPAESRLPDLACTQRDEV